MGTYTSKYTGEEIDSLLGQVESGTVGNGGGGSNTKAYLQKSVEGITKNTAFDMNIILNRGFEVSENNRIILKAGKTYIIQLYIDSFTGDGTSAEAGYGPTFDLTSVVCLYAGGKSVKYGQSGGKRIAYTPIEDTELTFITHEYCSSCPAIAVNCIIEEF